MTSEIDQSVKETWQGAKSQMVSKYRKLLKEYGDKEEAIQMSSDGQLFRFEKLMEVGDLEEATLLDFGCGRADFFQYLDTKVNNFTYTGIDIVPELVELSQNKYPQARILCKDVLSEEFDETFDYVFISMVLNNRVPNMDVFCREILKKCYSLCRKALAFNFVSCYGASENPNGINHDPVEIFKFCLENLSTQINISHHYGRKDVSVFVYKSPQ